MKTRTQGRKYLTDHLNAHIGRGNRRFHTMVPQEYQHMDLYNLKPIDIIDPYDRRVFVEESVDISLREKHPGVKKAYERYRILLDMVAEGKEIED